MPALPSLTPEDWVAQANDPNTLLAALFTTPTPEEIDRSAERLTLSGCARAFGIFGADPFGLGGGIVMSTGQVEDLPGANLEDGGVAGPVEQPLAFTQVDNTLSGATLFRADLTDPGFDPASLSILDDDSKEGSDPGIFTGLDIDRIALSRTRLDSATEAEFAALQTLDEFDFSPAGTRFSPGPLRSVDESDPEFGRELLGSRNGLVDQTAATLGMRDAVLGTANPFGYLSFGDGDRVIVLGADDPAQLAVLESDLFP